MTRAPGIVILELLDAEDSLIAAELEAVLPPEERDRLIARARELEATRRYLERDRALHDHSGDLA